MRRDILFSRIVYHGGSYGKAFDHYAGDPGSVPGLGRSPGEGNGSPFQYSCLEYPHGRKSLVDYSLWGHKESETTKRLHFHVHLQSHQQCVIVPVSQHLYLLFFSPSFCLYLSYVWKMVYHCAVVSAICFTFLYSQLYQKYTLFFSKLNMH